MGCESIGERYHEWLLCPVHRAPEECVLRPNLRLEDPPSYPAATLVTEAEAAVLREANK